MASSSSSSSSSACRVPPQWEYLNDVFVTFYGKDVRNNFLSHLFAAFRRESVKAFPDERLTREEMIMPNLLKAIEGSKISVIIFSKRYAFSERSMKELVRIMECQREYQFVIPVFYKVLPSDVRSQERSFGQAFVEHERNLLPGLDKWKAVLAEASDLPGWDSKVISFSFNCRSKKMDADGKKMESKTNSTELSGNSSQTQIPFLIMWCCLFIAWLLFYLPHEHKNENRVPALMLFTAHPSLFLALVIAVMLSFAGASGSLMLIGNKAGRVSKIRRCYSIMSFVSISSALSILAFALFLESFSWVSSGIFNLRQLNEDEADSFYVSSYVFQPFRNMGPAPFLQNNH